MEKDKADDNNLLAKCCINTRSHTKSDTLERRHLLGHHKSASARGTPRCEQLSFALGTASTGSCRASSVETDKMKSILEKRKGERVILDVLSLKR